MIITFGDSIEDAISVLDFDSTPNPNAMRGCVHVTDEAAWIVTASDEGC